MEAYTKEVTQRFVSAYYSLYALREIKSKKDFAKTVGTAPSNFTSMEDGTRNATVENICRLIHNFDISPVWIMLGEGDFKANNLKKL